MERTVRSLSTLSAVAGTILLGLGLTAGVRNGFLRHRGESLVLDATEKSFGTASAASLFPVEFTITNRSPEPVYVAGFSENYCMYAGCAKAVNLPLIVPTGESREVSFQVDARNPGDFDAPLTLFTSCPGRAKIELRITGKVLAALTGVSSDANRGRLTR